MIVLHQCACAHRRAFVQPQRMFYGQLTDYVIISAHKHVRACSLSLCPPTPACSLPGQTVMYGAERGRSARAVRAPISSHRGSSLRTRGHCDVQIGKVRSAVGPRSH